MDRSGDETYRDLLAYIQEHTETIHSVNRIMDSVFKITHGNVEKSQASSGGATKMTNRALTSRRRLPRFDDLESTRSG